MRKSIASQYRCLQKLNEAGNINSACVVLHERQVIRRADFAGAVREVAAHGARCCKRSDRRFHLVDGSDHRELVPQQGVSGTRLGLLDARFGCTGQDVHEIPTDRGRESVGHVRVDIPQVTEIRSLDDEVASECKAWQIACLGDADFSSGGLEVALRGLNVGATHE